MRIYHTSSAIAWKGNTLSRPCNAMSPDSMPHSTPYEQACHKLLRMGIPKTPARLVMHMHRRRIKEQGTNTSYKASTPCHMLCCQSAVTAAVSHLGSHAHVAEEALVGSPEGSPQQTALLLRHPCILSPMPGHLCHPNKGQRFYNDGCSPQ